MAPRALQGVGIGWRRELAHDLLARPEAVSFVEVVAEACFVRARARDEARALTETWPVIPHGVKLSLGSASGIDPDHARRLASLARDLRSPWVTEHVSFTRAGEREIGHLTQLPRTREAVRVVARNVAALRRHLGDTPLALENVAWTTRWPDDEMDEASFYQEVVAATGCPLLLDLGNLHANALNEQRDPMAVLDAFPVEQVAMVHIAGGDWIDMPSGRFFLDTHAHPVMPAIDALLARLVARRGAVPVILERDANFPAFDELAAEVVRTRTIVEGAAARPISPPSRRAVDDAPTPGLLAGQRHLAELLTATDAPGDVSPFAPGEVALAREVLRRKRIDDALPLIPRLAAHGVQSHALSWRAIDAHPRSARSVALNDAWHIAQAAMSDGALRGPATLDALVLSARSADDGAARSPRRGPWLGRRVLDDGRAAWAWKSFGAESPVHVLLR